MRSFRLVTISALVVLGLGTAACSGAARGESKAIAKNSTASPLQPTSAPTSTTAVPSTVDPTSAPPITAPSNPPTTTTFVLPTTTVVPKTTVRRVAPPKRPPNPPGPRRCPPGDLGKTGANKTGANVVCTHTATGYYWLPVP